MTKIELRKRKGLYYLWDHKPPPAQDTITLALFSEL